jgi:Tfp pilus assembly protein PilV
VTLVEVMIALILISVGIMAVARLFPTGSRSQLASRMQTVAGQYADEELERLRGLSRASAALSVGRHPASGYDSLGTTRSWLRCYQVTAMPAPLDSLLRVDTTVKWNFASRESVRMSGYLLP